MLDELLLGGEVQETSKKNVLKAIAAQDLLQEVGHVRVRLKVRTRSQLKISVYPHLLLITQSLESLVRGRGLHSCYVQLMTSIIEL